LSEGFVAGESVQRKPKEEAKKSTVVVGQEE
jgi:hypothetical protein